MPLPGCGARSGPLFLSRFQSRTAIRPDLESVGDVAFPRENAVLFSRANLVLWIRNAAAKPFSVTTVAKALDKDITHEPRDTDEELRDWLQARAVTVCGESNGSQDFVVCLPSPDVEPQPLWYKLFSRTGFVSRAQECLLYHPKGRGTQEIVVYALTADRKAAKRVIKWVV
jgi:hypothetical protein